jgi:hypothetical protein
MTDEYPPFRFDAGPHDPGAHRLAVPPDAAPPGVLPPEPTAGPLTHRAAAPPPPTTTSPWTTGRVLALAFGILAFLVSIALGIGGATLAVADNQLRDADGFLMSGHQPIATQTYAIVSDELHLHADAPAGLLPEGLLGDAKVTAKSDVNGPVFLGIAATSDVQKYLAGVRHAVVTDLPMDGDLGSPTYQNVPGASAPAAPGKADFWVAQSSGAGSQTITWPLESGSWTVVVMEPSGKAGVFADVSAGVTIPGLSWVIGILFTLAGTGLVIAVALLLVAFSSRRTAPTTGTGERL